MRVPSPRRFVRVLPVAGVIALVAGGSLAALAGTARSINAAGAFTAQLQDTQPAEAYPASAPQEAETTSQQAKQELSSGLIGSKHDFSKGGKFGRDFCLPCHTPHLLAAPPPLFDRRATTMSPLRPYQGVGLELTGWSLLCLGCHDGIVATDVYSVAHAITGTEQLANSRLGVTLLRSHPVGISYPAMSEKYEPPAAVEAAGLLLPGGRIQCTTCHDAHNTRRHRGMLRMSNQRSRLCLTCHRL